MTLTERASETPFKEYFVDADGFRIRYEEAGSGDAVVCVHGAGGLDVDLAHQLLAERHRVVALEMPGWGVSKPDVRIDDAPHMARILRHAVAAIGIEEYALLGTSLGGLVALWWATEAEGELTHLLLEAPAAFRLSDPDPVALSDREKFIAAFHAQPQRKPWLADFEPGPLPDPELFGRMMGPLWDEELESRVRSLAVPTLVMFGTADGVLSPDSGRHYTRLIPECFFALVYDAAHDLKGDRPEAFLDLIEDFMSEKSFLVNHDDSVINP